MSRPIEDLLPEKPEARLRIYAYSIEDGAHEGMLKIGQTTQAVKSRVEQQLKTALVKDFTIHVDESAERADGSVFTDHEVRARLRDKGFAKVDLEWMRCTPVDVQVAITELRTGQHFTGHPSRDVRDASRAGGGREQDACLLPLDLEGGHARGPALPVERQDALRQDVRRLPAGQEARRDQGAGGDVQAGGRGRVGSTTCSPTPTSTAGSTCPRPTGWTPRRPTRAAAGLLRVVPGPAGQGQGRQHQGQERLAARDQLGPGRLRRVPLRGVARQRQGAVRGRGRRRGQERAAGGVQPEPGGIQRGPRRAR